jgi:mycoredoxin
MSDQPITMYTTRWCGDCRFAKRLLDEWGVPYREVDIAEDDDARALVRHAARGFLSVPTIVFADGLVLVEPSRSELRSAIDARRAD